MAYTQECGDIEQARLHRSFLVKEFHEEFKSCNTSKDGVLNKEQFRYFQLAMDNQAETYGIRRRNTIEGEIFELYWEIFNGWTKKSGVKKKDIILIRRFCGMFGASFKLNIVEKNPEGEKKKSGYSFSLKKYLGSFYTGKQNGQRAA